MAARNTEALGGIEGGTLYPLSLLEKRAGVGRQTIREARSHGLPVRYCGGRGFILGQDWISYVVEREGQKDG